MKRIGPEIKLSKPRVPAVASDLYFDLRDRRLLPLVALVLVAIVAVPILLSGEREQIELPANGGVAAAIEASRDSAGLVVVEARPGLRDYRKRLDGRSPTDPFEQRHTAPANLDKAELGGGEGDGGGGGKTSTSTTDGSPAGGGSSPGSGSSPASPPPGEAPGGAPPRGGDGTRPGLTLFSWAIDVRIQKGPGKDDAAGGGKAEPVVKKRVLPATPLPNEKAPLVTYVSPGHNAKGKINGKVVLLLSDKVREVAGDAKCLSGKETCQLLEVTPGFPIWLVYGGNEVRYTVNVTRLHLVVTGHT